MSGAQTSTFGDPNILLSTLSGAQTAAVQRNQLLNQLGQQEIAANNTEVVARAASTLLDPTLYPTEEARAAGWAKAIPILKANGYAPNAPDAYPGLEHLQLTARLGTPSADLFKLGVDRQAKGAIAPGDGGTTATGGGGGGTGTVGGTGGDGLTGDKAHDLPLIAQRESGGNPTVLNYVAQQDPTAYQRGATASGKYQIVNSTWREGLQLAGLDPAQYATARDAPEQVQDKVASAIYDKYGNKPWQKGTQDWVRDEQGRYQMATVRPAAGAPGGAPSAAASGAPTAPAVVTGDVGRPGDVPPRPGGAPGAYPAYGGGMGAVIGGQPAAARATIPAGRPTGPPVITDQPAGSNVVAGPPGVATVGAPQPPGPAVAGNVAAINAGIAGAGGQPVTDPNLTPTPARYAGTAPAPSVEAAPQPGWGTGIGSGYGPQNALAPAPVQPAPARPATPAQPAAAQPPAADTLPPLPAPTPPAPTNRNGLTALQQQDIERRRGMTNVSSDELQKRVDAYVATNAAVAEKYQQDQVAYVREMRERQTTAGAAAHQTLEEQRQAAADAATAAERARVAAREAKQDDLAAAKWKAEQEATARVVANPFGNDDTGKLRYILSDPTSDPKSPTYHAAWAAYANPQTVNGVTMPGHVMTPFRMPLDADGVPVTTYDKPAMALAPGDLTQYRKITEQSGTLNAALDEFSRTAKNASLGERLRTVAGGSTDLRSSWTNLAMLAKGDALYQLGVLSGPDMEVIRGALADPSTFMGSLASNETIDKQVGRIKKILATRLDQARESYLPGVKPADTKPADTPATRPPLSSFEK